jgi:transcriptional regulator with XRE-family HTH domain
MKGLPVEDVIYNSIIAEISAQLVLKRVKLKMTQEEFAKHLDFSQSTLSKYENGIENLTVKKLAELLSKLNLSAELVCRHQEDHQAYQPRHADVPHTYLLRSEETIVPQLPLPRSKLERFGIEIDGGVDDCGKELWVYLKAG